MSIKKILAHVRGTNQDSDVVRAAADIAGAFGADVDVLFVRQDPTAIYTTMTTPLTGYAVEGLIEAAAKSADEASERARGHAEEVLRESAYASVREHVNMVDAVGDGYEVLRHHSGLADLLVLPSENTKKTDFPSAVVESTIIGCARPVLIVADDKPTDVTGTVLVAWDGGHEAANALVWAVPLLAKAAKVEVLIIGEADGVLESEQAIAYLKSHGVSATTRTAELGDKSIGERVVEEAQKAGASLLVMGAYGHSRVREFILGGTSRYVLTHADFPVLMAH